ncbi:sensor histidine kinase [Clostridium oryzae]|uniref:sensor histidine kinase n=1 Tax=Clostridium oryzae TaxID=1450648 RepID=UPI0014743960|nr:histidine kinase [Clostridium oryzae]
MNSKLIEYSFKEKDFAISSERDRISQELHDSLGHLLMALSMNVKYVKSKVSKEKDVDYHEIEQIEDLVQESIKTLRGTVYSLRKLNGNFNLKEELNKVIGKFDNLNMVSILFDYDDEIENCSVNIKNILIATIKEAITNSVKHGNSSQIHISISLEHYTLKLAIEDNGSGCSNIVKSNGLNGISNRFKSAGGNVTFSSKKQKGFKIVATIEGSASVD